MYSASNWHIEHIYMWNTMVTSVWFSNVAKKITVIGASNIEWHIIKFPKDTEF